MEGKVLDRDGEGSVVRSSWGGDWGSREVDDGEVALMEKGSHPEEAGRGSSHGWFGVVDGEDVGGPIPDVGVVEVEANVGGEGVVGEGAVDGMAGVGVGVCATLA